MTVVNSPDDEDQPNQWITRSLAVRSLFGGALMGLANLVPGISGGTMLLATGIYPRFIEALADVTRFRYRVQSLWVLGCVVGAAGLGILLLAGTLKGLVIDHRWVMYSLFIGLTLGWHSRGLEVGPARFSGVIGRLRRWSLLR